MSSCIQRGKFQDVDQNEKITKAGWWESALEIMCVQTCV